MKPEKILFIINPISGGKDKEGIKNLIFNELRASDFDVHLRITEYAGHAMALAAWAVAEEFDVVVAVGGDGTLNEVAGQLVGTNIPVGIIPYGSGNGLARHLKIPLNASKALRTIKEGIRISMDTGALNGRPFFNMAGVGLDAKIAHIFATNKKRGFKNYIKLALKELVGLEPTRYQIIVDGQFYHEDIYFVSIANSPQFGNDMNIAKDATVRDGLFDVCIFNAFPLWMVPWYGVAMKLKILKSKHLKIVQGKKIEIVGDATFYAHTDGEAFLVEERAGIEMFPLSLHIIVPKSKSHEKENRTK